MSDVLAQLVDEVRSDAASLGLILHGSRATGDHRADSDYDLIRVVTDDAYEGRKATRTLLERRESDDGPQADVLHQGVGRLKWLAEHPGWWTATYATARIIVDKDGDIDRQIGRAHV